MNKPGPASRPKRRVGCLSGCLGGLVVALGVVLAVYAIIAPWSFHIGGRWTPLTAWWGVGQLRDSAGAEYGVYLRYYPYIPNRGRSGTGSYPTGRPLPACPVRGDAWVCTAGGARYRFDIRGSSYGAWLRTDGSELNLSLAEPGNAKIRRTFTLYGTWHGPDLVMDDHKSMFIHFRPGGELTPATSYTAPVPERYARVTLQWGSQSDFDSICTNLARKGSSR